MATKAGVSPSISAAWWSFSRRRSAESDRGRHQTAPYKEEESETRQCRGKQL